MSDASQDVPEDATEEEEAEVDYDLLTKEEAKDAPVVDTPEATQSSNLWKQRQCLEACIEELRELGASPNVLRAANQAYRELLTR